MHVLHQCRDWRERLGEQWGFVTELQGLFYEAHDLFSPRVVLKQIINALLFVNNSVVRISLMALVSCNFRDYRGLLMPVLSLFYATKSYFCLKLCVL